MGNEWSSRGWAEVLKVLYETDVTIEVSQYRREREGEVEVFEIESLHKDSPLLSETNLAEEQAVDELRYLRKNGLVDFVKPFDDNGFVVHRLTSEGFEVAHDLHAMKREEDWQERNTEINRLLTIATVILAATAVIQALAAILQQRGWVSLALILVYITVGVFLFRAMNRILPENMALM